jgi:hypothetical protein
MVTRENNPTYEFVWRGRTHLGDEPGIYGDAYYAGLCAEWPLTMRRYDPKDTSDGGVRVRLEAEDVGVLPPYPGHRVSVACYVMDRSSHALSSWRRLSSESACDCRMQSNPIELDITLPGGFAALYLSVRIEVDTTMHPGLYDDFVVTRLSIFSTTHFASFGFEFEAENLCRRIPGCSS